MTTDNWRLRLGGIVIVHAKTEQLRLIVETRTAAAVVWPDEGMFDTVWVFNQDHADFEPLLIDVQTANALLTMRSALKPENQAKFDVFVSAHRGTFGKMVELAWKATTPVRKS